MPEFRSLAQMLAPPVENEPPTAQLPAAAAISSELHERGVDLREVRLFRAHLAEALERAVHGLRCEIAREILGRELALAPVDVRALLDASLERYRHLAPLRARVHADDVALAGDCGIAVFADDTLSRGDICIDLKNGSLDLRLSARVDALIGPANQS
ncbi:MAG: FliH/SctL family protein [Candidatus Eremiobacteraeota bacterium]|nr:FliH/SctL family protein [Candidatus Eremiobacteraeota bacterium]